MDNRSSNEIITTLEWKLEEQISSILLNFQRFGKMKGMGQIVTWSVRDETLHTESIIKLFRTFVQENPEIWDEELKARIYNA